MSDRIREAFEKFHAEHLRKMGMDEHDIATERDRLENGDYQWSMAAEAWPYWQAAAALAQQPTQAAAVPHLTAPELSDLMDFHSAVCCDHGHTVEKEGMRRLAQIGAVESVGFGKHRLTEFGVYLLAAAPAAPVAQEPCGGCGATDESQRCIGCMHQFAPPATEHPTRAMQALATISRMARNEACRSGAPSAGQLCTWDAIADMADAALAESPAAEQPACPGCNGHGLVGGFVSAESGYDAEECPFCCGDGFIHGTECGACAEQPDTVAVPRDVLRELADTAIAEWHDPSENEAAQDRNECLCCGAEDGHNADCSVAIALRLLAGGAA